MRAFLVLLVVLLVLVVVGWIKFSNTPQQSTISIDKEAIKQDTEGVVERGNEFLDRTRQAVDTSGTDTTAPQPAAPIEAEPSTAAPQPAPPGEDPNRPAAATTGAIR